MENKGGKRLAPTGEPVKTTPPATAADEVKTPAEQPAPAESAAPAPAETAAPAAKPAKSRGRRLWDDYGYLLVTLAAVFVLFKVLLQLAYVPSGSMETTIPTKCLLHSAELVEDIKNQGKDIGVEVDGVKVNFQQVIAHKNAISKQLTSGVAGLLKLNKVKKVDGTAKFTGEKQLEVTKPDGSKESMTADAIIVATGSVNAQPPIPGLKENPNCIDSTGALSLDKLPATMVVIGGGVIGLELACAYAAFGTKITVVEAMDHMLPMLDGDLTKIGVAHMKKMGMDFHLETYSEHSLDEGSTSRAASYVGLMWGDNTVTWGAGTDTDIIVAGIKALVSAINSK